MTCTWGIVIFVLAMVLVTGLVIAASMLSSRMNEHAPLGTRDEIKEEANEN